MIAGEAEGQVEDPAAVAVVDGVEGSEVAGVKVGDKIGVDGVFARRRLCAQIGRQLSQMDLASVAEL